MGCWYIDCRQLPTEPYLAMYVLVLLNLSAFAVNNAQGGLNEMVKSTCHHLVWQVNRCAIYAGIPMVHTIISRCLHHCMRLTQAFVGWNVALGVWCVWRSQLGTSLWSDSNSTDDEFVLHTYYCKWCWLVSCSIYVRRWGSVSFKVCVFTRQATVCTAGFRVMRSWVKRIRTGVCMPGIWDFLVGRFLMATYIYSHWCLAASMSTSCHRLEQWGRSLHDDSPCVHCRS